MSEISIAIEDDYQKLLEPEAVVSSVDLSKEERDRYHDLLADVDRLQRIEDDQVAKSIRLASRVDEEWQVL